MMCYKIRMKIKLEAIFLHDVFGSLQMHPKVIKKGKSRRDSDKITL